MRELVAITKALADEHRIRILMSLSSDELCVCEIIALFKLAPSTISKHVAILHQAGLLQSRKEGRWVYYCLAAKEKSSPSVIKVIKWVQESLRSDAAVKSDAKRLKNISRMSKESLCACYKDALR